MLKTVLAACVLLCALTVNADARHRHHRHHHHHHARHASERAADATILPHPSGCPSRLFCGCGAAVHIFGAPIRSLWLAANWFRFPRAQPASGMVAVRRHHVFVLEQNIRGNVWLVFDANSGRHATRIHPRSIAGYVIVNPRG